MKLILRNFLVILFLSSITTVALANENLKSSINSHVKIDYRTGIWAYLPVLDDDFELEVNEAFHFDTLFKNTDRKSRITVLVREIDLNQRKVSFSIKRQDYRGDRAVGSSTYQDYSHSLNGHALVVKLRGQDPASNGTFRVQLSF